MLLDAVTSSPVTRLTVTSFFSKLFHEEKSSRAKAPWRVPLMTDVTHDGHPTRFVVDVETTVTPVNPDQLFALFV